MDVIAGMGYWVCFVDSYLGIGFSIWTGLAVVVLGNSFWTGMESGGGSDLYREGFVNLAFLSRYFSNAGHLV